jgi:Cu-Zn family superoxide dismutase
VLLLEEMNFQVTIKGEIKNLPKNAKLGFHVHESGDTRNETHPCDSAGGHFNPDNVSRKPACSLPSWI